jgi:hypothetical protein
LGSWVLNIRFAASSVHDNALLSSFFFGRQRSPLSGFETWVADVPLYMKWLAGLQMYAKFDAEFQTRPRIDFKDFTLDKDEVDAAIQMARL